MFQAGLLKILSETYNLTRGDVLMKDQKIRTMTVTAMFTAIIVVLTTCFQIRTVNDGYIHFGDSAIYLAACMLPAPYAMFAASAGGAISDLISGSAIWAIPTFIIKALNTLPFLYAVKKIKKDSKIITTGTIIASVISGIITIAGYWLAEGLMFGFAVSTVSSFFRGLIQPVSSAVIFIGVGSVLEKAKFKSVVTGK